MVEVKTTTGDPGWDDAEELLAKAKRSKRAEIDAEYAACLQRGVSWNSTRWTATDLSRDVLVELTEIAEQDGGPVAILDAYGQRFDLSLSELQDLRAAVRKYRSDARVNRLTLHDSVASAASVDDVQAIDATAGWPG